MKIKITPKVADYLFTAVSVAIEDYSIWPPEKEESIVIMQLRELAKEAQ